MNHSSVRVIDKTEQSGGTFLLRLEAPVIAAGARPGQFVMIGCGEDTVLPRPISIHRCHGDGISLLFSVVGRGTKNLSDLRSGDVVQLTGPLGNGFSLPEKGRDTVLIAGGIGIAPLCFLADEIRNAGGTVNILYGNSCADRYHDEALDEFCTVATDDGSEGYHGLITDLVKDIEVETKDIYACGPLPMYRTMSRMEELKGRNVRVSLEVRMACGRGICYGCSVKTTGGMKKVCEQGPVFTLDEIDWDWLR